jgi:hypothetical protein
MKVQARAGEGGGEYMNLRNCYMLLRMHFVNRSY